MKEGFAGSDLTFAMASSSVPITLGLAGLSKPMWLSLICRKVSLPGWAASAPSMIPSESGTPPEIVHSTPVPAQVMHSNTFRQLTSAFRSLFAESLMVILRRLVVSSAGDRAKTRLIPGSQKSEDLDVHLRSSKADGGEHLKSVRPPASGYRRQR